MSFKIIVSLFINETRGQGLKDGDRLGSIKRLYQQVFICDVYRPSY